ncbi:MAG TPA: histidine phosphatase family protein [Blastocatellia bacterium]|jgi:phosphohistidine phosphatase
MKTLLLLRHAKSSWDEPNLRDFDRPLAKRGKRDAPRMGEALRERGPLPDFVLCSPAQRARSTMKAFVKAAGIDTEPQFEEGIYEASSAELIQIARRLPDGSACALMVGHNPGFEDLLSRLTGSFERMTTAALACIEFDIERWEAIEDGQGKLAWLMTPKQLGGEDD